MAQESMEVLTALDKARTQWYHVTAVVIAGMGFFTDAYDLFCVSLVSKLLGRLYYYDPSTGKPGVLPPTVNAAVNGVALCGTLAGQLFFGQMGDRFGRKKVYGITLIMMIFCSIASGLSFGNSAGSVLTTLCFFRFWLGFGIGGDYPLSATIMSEYANTKTRGAFIAAVFAMQGMGILAAAAVSIVVTQVFMAALPRLPSFNENQVLSTPPEADFLWRIVFMLGSIPAALTFYWRMKMPETARYTALVQKNHERAAADMRKVLKVDIDVQEKTVNQATSEEYGLFSWEFARRHGKHFLGTTTTWFLLDIAFYSQQLFQKDIFVQVKFIRKAGTMSALDEVYKIASAQALVALFSTVPGYWFTVAFIDKLGRFKIQLMGFAMMTIFMFALGIPYDYWRGTVKDSITGAYINGHTPGFVILFALTFFFANFGPNSTTFIVPAELFPARLRSTCHGLSAAAGKAGAIIGAFGFSYASQSRIASERDPGYKNPGLGMQGALICLAFINLLGFLCTFLVPETNGKSLEDLSGENEIVSESQII